MAKRTCVDCGGDHYSRDLCSRCYMRRWRKGTLGEVREYLRWPENLLQRMEPQPNGCIHYTGTIDSNGYGKSTFPAGDSAHRAAYELFVGPIPDGFTIDHECHNADETCVGGPTCLHRRCVNWEHLSAKPSADNTKASDRSTGSINAAKTHCIHGHEYTPENTYVSPGRPGSRECRKCNRDATARWTAKRRGAPPTASS